MSAHPDIYESNRYLAEYLLFHFGEAHDFLPYSFGPREALHFPQRCAQLCREVFPRSRALRALDLGCAVGRASFELARFCREVVGVDFSRKFIRAAQTLKRRGFLKFKKVEEGRIVSAAKAVVPKGINRSRVIFERGDACRLRRDIGFFDIVLSANLIDRLVNPRQCLEKIPSLLHPGGVLAITSPCTWMEEFTPRKNWLGGFNRNGRPLRTFEGLRCCLEPAFSLIIRRDMPFLIREHARKFQWNVADATVWKLNPTS